MDSDRKKVLLFAFVGVALPVLYIFLAAIFSDLEVGSIIFLLISAAYSGFAVKNYIDLKTEKKEHNSPVIVVISIIIVLIMLLFAVGFLIALLTGEKLIPAQR